MASNTSQNEPGEIDFRMFGQLQCEDCGRSWYSGNTWNDYAQDCNSCLGKGFPIWRRPLEKRKILEKRPPHDKAKCEKCAEVGDCTKLETSKNNRSGRGRGRGRGRRRGGRGRGRWGADHSQGPDPSAGVNYNETNEIPNYSRGTRRYRRRYRTGQEPTSDRDQTGFNNENNSSSEYHRRPYQRRPRGRYSRARRVS